MSVVAFRKPTTPEEASLQTASSVIELASTIKALIENPGLLKQLGQDAAASRALTEEQVKQHDAALEIIANATKAQKTIADAHAALEQHQKDLEAEHQQRVALLKKQQSDFLAKADTNAKMINAHEDEIEELRVNVKKEAERVATDRSLLDGREAELERRGKELGETHKAFMAAGQNKINEQQAVLDKREKSLDAKQRKLDELKAALKE